MSDETAWNDHDLEPGAPVECQLDECDCADYATEREIMYLSGGNGDPAPDNSEHEATLVREISDQIGVYLDAYGFFARCTAPDCTYVTEYTAAKHVATRWATAHYEDQPGDGRAN